MDVSLEAQTKPLATLSAFSYIPPRRQEPKEMTYFNTDSKVQEVSMYDQVFHQAEGYDMRLHRDDRKHHKGRGLDMNEEAYANRNPTAVNLPQPQADDAMYKLRKRGWHSIVASSNMWLPQEKSRAMPVRSSAEYGRRSVPALYQTGRRCNRVACIKAEFFMKNGIIWDVAQGYGSVAPM